MQMHKISRQANVGKNTKLENIKPTQHDYSLNTWAIFPCKISFLPPALENQTEDIKAPALTHTHGIYCH